MSVTTLVLEVDDGSEKQPKRVELSTSGPAGTEYAATNALMEEMRKRIKDAHNRELAGVGGAECQTRPV